MIMVKCETTSLFVTTSHDRTLRKNEELAQRILQRGMAKEYVKTNLY